MAKAAARRVIDYLLDRLDEGLRTVLVVSGSEYSVEYIRDDLRRAYSQETFTRVVETFRLKQPLFTPEIEAYPVGERRAVVHYHEHAFVLQFPFSESETILISVEEDVGRDLLEFIDTCRRLVEDDA